MSFGNRVFIVRRLLQVKFRWQRTAALFFVLLLSSAILLQSSIIFAIDNLEDGESQIVTPPKAHHNSEDKRLAKEPEGADKSMARNYPTPKDPSRSDQIASADAKPITERKRNNMTRLDHKTDAPLNSVAANHNKIEPRELEERRNETTSEFVNEDGSITQKQYMTPKFFKKDNRWIDIKTTLKEDKNAGDSRNLFGKLYGNIRSAFSEERHFVTEDNAWQTRFAPSDHKLGMVRIKKGDQQVSFIPENSKKVAPVISTNDQGQQVVHYYDLWPGVNVEYIVESAAIKENIILKDKNATTNFSFKIEGAELELTKLGDMTGSVYKIKGALDDDFAIAPVNLILNEFGMVTDEKRYGQSYENGSFNIFVDNEFLQSLPDKAFPAVIDPAVFNSSFGTRAGGNYVSFKTDGYICYSNVCNPYAGGLYDSSYNLQHWRSAIHSSYSQFQNPNNVLLNATLHLTQRSNESFWTGDWGAHTFWAGHATCLNNFNCVNTSSPWGNATFTGSGSIDLTSFYADRIAANDWNAWVMLMGDSSDHGFKNFDPNNSYVSFTYGGPPSPPSIASPTQNQVFVDVQPTLKVNPSTNPNGSTPLKYELLVSTGQGATGGLITSNLLDSTLWSVPDGVLEDGNTYYVQARSYDPITSTTSSWGTSVPFRIDMRTGKNQTQSYDEINPVTVDLATGNLTTSTGSHMSAALGGNLGISLNYSSPFKSRNGLVGEYYNSNYSYAFSRVDQTVDFNWGSGSPSSGTLTDDFLVAWSGYFVTPTSGTYYFGGKHENGDSMLVNVKNQLRYWGSGSCTPACYGTSVYLDEGEVVNIYAELDDAISGGNAQARIYVKGPVDEQVLPSAWVHTGVRPISKNRGLTGRYYARLDGTNNFSSGNPLAMQRNDQLLSFNWGSGAPNANGPTDFLVRWSGYITAPTTGTYNFGAVHDDGVKITIGSSTVVLDRSDTGEHYGTGHLMVGGQTEPITIEYYDTGGNAKFEFKVQGSVPNQIVPSRWLSSKSQVLPDGWNIGIDPDGNLSYERLKSSLDSVILTDSTGLTHEYKWTGSGYKPPINEDGQLIKNADGSYILIDVDGRTYVFNNDGTLKSATNPTDDITPTAIQYEYESPGGGPSRISKIKDGVDPSRFAEVFYSGDSECGTQPSGFDSNAPIGMICAVSTNDGRFTYLRYIDGLLRRVEKPDNEMHDYGYELIYDASNTLIGGRLSKVYEPIAMDTVAAGIRPDGDVATEVNYDAIGRARQVRMPPATALAPAILHEYEYMPEALDKSYKGVTKLHVNGQVEPNGYNRMIKYDNLFRTIESTDTAGLSTKTEWSPLKDLLLSTTDPAGNKSTNIYDDEDRISHQYGPANEDWYEANGIPKTAYASQIPHQEIRYDEGIVGLAVAWHDYSRQSANQAGILFGAPKLHTTGIDPSSPGNINSTLASPPIGATSGMQGIGFSASGKLRLPSGTYTLKSDTSDGVRIWVDDILIVDSWQDASHRTVSGGGFTVTNGELKRIRIDAYRRTSSTGSFSVQMQQTSGFTWTSNWSSYVSPAYHLVTTEKIYDSITGNSITETGYGSNPELNLPTTVAVDSPGLNLVTTSTYETQGVSGSLLRKTSETLPGSNTTHFTHYGATETKDNPCTVSVTETYRQAGMLKIVTEPDPDGVGGRTSRQIEYIYDDAGRLIASRYNTDDWTCSFYDGRGRLTLVHIPNQNGNPADTIQHNYAVFGNPLQSSIQDNSAYLTSTKDLYGRIVSYSDAYGSTTAYNYDSFGKLISKNSDIGLEEFVYDNYTRLLEHKLNSTTYATIVYDSFGRIDFVEYDDANQLRKTYFYDDLGREEAYEYLMGDGATTVRDEVGYSQSSKITTGTLSSGLTSLSTSYSYDLADRLVSATIGSNTYAYGFGLQNSTECGTSNEMNPNSGRNGNRTSLTVNGVTTYECYDFADMTATHWPTVIYSYDDHGSLAGLIKPAGISLNLNYDVRNRVRTYMQYTQSGDGTYISFENDPYGRQRFRQSADIVSWSYNFSDYYFYGYTGEDDAHDYVRNANWDMIEKRLNLPGDVTITLKDFEPAANAQKEYSLPNTHGDTLLLVAADGSNISAGSGPAGAHIYDPFGNADVGNMLPVNTIDGSYGYVGSYGKFTASTLQDFNPIHMGARIYLPTIGRFTTPDPIRGGNANSYTYPLDPINKLDTTGLAEQGKGLHQLFNLSAEEFKALQQGKNKLNQSVFNAAMQKQKANEKFQGQRHSRHSGSQKKPKGGSSKSSPKGSKGLNQLFLLEVFFPFHLFAPKYGPPS